MKQVAREAHGSHVVQLVDEPEYAFGSRGNRPRYEREEVLGDARFELSSRHALICMRDGAPFASVIFGAVGGASGVHEHSLVLQGDLGFLAIGAFIACVELPSLETRWVREVDAATCFGAHVCPDGESLVSHGELVISRLTLDGEVLWQAGGRDIFTGDLRVSEAAVHVEDDSGDVYSFELETGAVRRDG